jgi:hypothetical protein
MFGCGNVLNEIYDIDKIKGKSGQVAAGKL